MTHRRHDPREDEAVRLAAIRAAFPRRPLAVLPPMGGWRQATGSIWVLLLLGGGLLAGGAGDLPLLATDISLAVSGNAVELPEHYLGPDSRCRIIARIVVQCDLALRGRAAGGLWESRRVSYTYLGGLPDSLRAIPVVGWPKRPHRLTTAAAMDRLWNRLFTAALVLGLGILIFLSLTRSAFVEWREGRRLRAALSGKPLEPVLLDCQSPLGETSSARRADAFVLRRDPEGTELLATGEPLEKLLVLGGRTAPPARVLGVAGGEAAMPLDRKLRWIGLTAEEREAIRRAAGIEA